MTMPHHAIVAIVYEYTDAVDLLLARLAAALSARGIRLAGFVQRDEPREDRDKCDMILHDLSSGEDFRISEDRGRHARGCRLNVDWLLTAANAVLEALDAGPDVLFINKFGKIEAEGGGLRHLIVRALDLDVPVLVAVPARNLDSWRAFCGDAALEIPFALAAQRHEDIAAHLRIKSSENVAEPDPGSLDGHRASASASAAPKR